MRLGIAISGLGMLGFYIGHVYGEHRLFRDELELNKIMTDELMWVEEQSPGFIWKLCIFYLCHRKRILTENHLKEITAQEKADYSRSALYRFGLPEETSGHLKKTWRLYDATRKRLLPPE